MRGEATASSLSFASLRIETGLQQCSMDQEHQRGLAPSVRRQAIGPRASGAGSAREIHQRTSPTQRRKLRRNLERTGLTGQGSGKGSGGSSAKLRAAIQSETAKQSAEKLGTLADQRDKAPQPHKDDAGGAQRHRQKQRNESLGRSKSSRSCVSRRAILSLYGAELELTSSFDRTIQRDVAIIPEHMRKLHEQMCAIHVGRDDPHARR